MSSEKQIVIPKKQMALALLVLVALIVLSSFWIIFSLNNKLDLTSAGFKDGGIPAGNNIKDAENQRLPFIKIIILKKSDCSNCVSLDFLAEAIKTQFDVNVLEVKEVESDSQEGMDLIEMHEIKKLPSLIVNGEFQGTELQQLWLNVGEESNGVLILRNVLPPFFSLEENRLVGGVNFILIRNSDCVECEDLNLFSGYIEDLNVVVESKKTLEFDSAEAKEIIKQYFIDRVPVVLLTGDIAEYKPFYSVWIQGGGRVEENAYIYEEAVPYFDLESREVKGLVEIVRLIDENCSGCIDSNVLVAPLTEKLRMKVVKDTTFNISSSEGKALIEKYSITKVPAIIVSKEAEVYSKFVSVWEAVGTQEEDKSFVFRNLEVLGGNFTELE